MSVKQNYFYSLLNTISGLLFPIITFPYVARILMADGIGQVNFYLSIINYISMFAGLGIPTYAIREIARVKTDVKVMNQVAVEILLLHTFLTLLGYIVVGVVALTVAHTIFICLFATMKKDLQLHKIDISTSLPLKYADEGIRAGFPSPAQDYLEQAIDLNKELIKHPASTFYGRVIGDSMRDEGIEEGDILVIDKSLELLAIRN